MEYAHNLVAEEHTRALVDIIQQFHAKGGLRFYALKPLADHQAEFVRVLQASILEEVPEFTLSRNPQVLETLERHIAELTVHIDSVLCGNGKLDFDFIIEHGKQRAEQHFPIESTLHAYRCVHKELSLFLRQSGRDEPGLVSASQDLVTVLADFSLEFSNTVSRIFTDAYLAQVQLLADVAGDKRSQLLNCLLEGYDESDRRVASILRDEGYLTGRLAFCVALVQTQDPTELLNPQRARRLIQAIVGSYKNSNIQCLIDMHNNKVTIIFSSVHRQSGWSGVNEGLAEKVSAALELLSATVLVGLSSDVYAISRLPAAHREALQALDHAKLRNRVVRFADLSALQVMFHLAQFEFSKTLPAWASGLEEANQKSAGVLIDTIKAYADANMNVQLAAQSLKAHPNTIYARFQKITDITGLDPRSFSGLADLLLVGNCLQAQLLDNDRSVEPGS